MFFSQIVLERLSRLNCEFPRIFQYCAPLNPKLGIEQLYILKHISHVKATMKRQKKTEAELLDHATNNLLRALKRDMLKKEGRVDSNKLRKDGYSARLIARLEQA